MRITYKDVPGTFRPAKPGAVVIGPAEPSSVFQVTLELRGKSPLPQPEPYAKPLSLSEIEDSFGATEADMQLVEQALPNLEVVDRTPSLRTMELRGTVAQMEEAFDVQLFACKDTSGSLYRGRNGIIRIPQELDGVVLNVLGLDDRQIGKRRPLRPPAQAAGSAPRKVGPAELATRYSFPPGAANGITIAVLEFTGGFFQSDLDLYCSQISNTTSPVVQQVPVGLQPTTLAAINAIADPTKQQDLLNDAAEINMDVQVIAAFCPQAKIKVYFAPFTPKGWQNNIQAALKDGDAPKIFSVSYGIAEDHPDLGKLTPASLQTINRTFQTASLAGVTVCVSSGDDGADQDVDDGQAHVAFPASSPFVLAVGGTSFDDGQPDRGWRDAPGNRLESGGGSTGGGRSVIFATPTWQQSINVTSLRPGELSGRCVPDVSALSADPLYDLILDGSDSPNGGTSAAAPLWAALLGRIAGNLPAGQSIGFLPPKLYQTATGGTALGASVTTDVTNGNNDVDSFTIQTQNGPFSQVAVTGYQAGPGYDAISGWGVPIGTALQAALAAGPPRSP